MSQDDRRAGNLGLQFSTRNTRHGHRQPHTQHRSGESGQGVRVQAVIMIVQEMGSHTDQAVSETGDQAAYLPRIDGEASGSRRSRLSEVEDGHKTLWWQAHAAARARRRRGCQRRRRNWITKLRHRGTCSWCAPSQTRRGATRAASTRVVVEPRRQGVDDRQARAQDGIRGSPTGQPYHRWRVPRRT